MFKRGTWHQNRDEVLRRLEGLNIKPWRGNLNDPEMVRKVKRARCYVCKERRHMYWNCPHRRTNRWCRQSSMSNKTEDSKNQGQSIMYGSNTNGEKEYMDCVFEAPIPPKIGDHEVCLFDLFMLVDCMGGEELITSQDKWEEVVQRFGFPGCLKNRIQGIYERYLGLPISYFEAVKDEFRSADKEDCKETAAVEATSEERRGSSNPPGEVAYTVVSEHRKGKEFFFNPQEKRTIGEKAML